MPGGLETSPADELSGLPLPLVPTAIGGLEDWHHHAHPRLSPMLEGEGGIAVRNARIQRTDARGNHGYYHDFYVGPELPATEEDKFIYTVWACAGYIPEYGLDFPNGRPIKKKLAPEHTTELRSGDLKPESLHRVRRFMRNHIAMQDLSEIQQGKIDEFMNARRTLQRLEAGNWILERLVGIATESIQASYKRARKKELLRPGIEPKLSEFILGLVGTRFEQESMHGKLRTRLGALAVHNGQLEFQPDVAVA